MIVPVFNAENYLRQCLDSLVNQTYPNYEVICIDDCSSDSSQAILADYAGRYSDILTVLYNAENVGQGKSRILGLSIASGEYIMFVDSDDYVAGDYISRYVAEVLHQDFDLIIGGYTRDVDGALSPYIPSDSVWSVVTYSVACCKKI